MNTLARSIVGIALTAGAVYLMDPVSGRRRRVLLRDQCERAAKRLNLGRRGARHDISERAHALASRTKTAASRGAISDKAVSKNACGAIRHAVRNPDSIALAVDEGHVILRGSVFPHEHQRLLDEVRAAPGVRIVSDHLTEIHTNGQSSLDASHQFRSAAKPGGWSVAGRVLAGCAGGALVFWGVRERKALGAFGATVGHTLWRISKEEFERSFAAAKEGLGETGDAVHDAAQNAADTVREKAEEGTEWAQSVREQAQASRRSTDSKTDVRGGAPRAGAVR